MTTPPEDYEVDTLRIAPPTPCGEGCQGCAFCNQESNMPPEKESAAGVAPTRVLNALEVLERAALRPESQGTAAQFLKRLGESGMWVIESPLAASGVKAAPEDQQEREHSYRENADFQAWWEAEQVDPLHTIIVKNAAHAAWQERARRARNAGGQPSAENQPKGT